MSGISRLFKPPRRSDYIQRLMTYIYKKNRALVRTRQNTSPPSQEGGFRWVGNITVGGLPPIQANAPRCFVGHIRRVWLYNKKAKPLRIWLEEAATYSPT